MNVKRILRNFVLEIPIILLVVVIAVGLLGYDYLVAIIGLITIVVMLYLATISGEISIGQCLKKYKIFWKHN